MHDVWSCQARACLLELTDDWNRGPVTAQDFAESLADWFLHVSLAWRFLSAAHLTINTRILELEVAEEPNWRKRWSGRTVYLERSRHDRTIPTIEKKTANPKR